MSIPADVIAEELWAQLRGAASRLRAPGGHLVAAEALIGALNRAGLPAAVLLPEVDGAELLRTTGVNAPLHAVSGPEASWARQLGLRAPEVIRGSEGRAVLLTAPLHPEAAAAAGLLLNLLEGALRVAHPEALGVALASHQRQLTVLGETARLVRGLAHDVRNILNVLSPALELPPEFDSRGRRVSAEERLEELLPSLAEARGATARLQHVLDRVSAITKAGGAPQSALDVGEVLLDGEHALVRAAGPQHTLELHVAPGLPQVRAEEHNLVRMLAELVENGREASAPGGTITVTVRPLELRPDEAPPHRRLAPGSWVHVAVEDHGSGMTPDNAERFLRAFESSAKARSRVGLGLTELAVVVAAAQGQLRIDSAMFKGTTVHVFLPAAPLAAQGGLPPLDIQLNVQRLDLVVIALSMHAEEILYSAMLKSGGFDVAAVPARGGLGPAGADPTPGLNPAAVLFDDPDALRPGGIVARLRAAHPSIKAVFLGWDIPGADGFVSAKMKPEPMVSELRRVIAASAPSSP